MVHLFIAFLAAFVAGGINSVAGGGTMVSFPALMALGLSPMIANATNTAGIWWGSLGSIWGFRREIAKVPKIHFWFVIPALLGGTVGAVLLRVTSADTFEKIVPWLILFATGLFIIQAPVQRWLRSEEAAQKGSRRWFVLALLAQFAVAVYGGYFGAGMSILMLSILGLIGMKDILEMSAMTSLLALCINGVAGIIFAATGLVHWPDVPAMAVGSIAGGYGAAGLARKIGKTAIRRFVILVGITIAIVMFIRVARGS